ncbi:hypothetical protein Dsin_013369 [Dipteronia sinensis]|uniref:DUF4283 domain-containing protein n=1 Tax=Dipteronia sinensis TaxID=43782 RepID=A0AAE0E920_9ROSI|nr:hypothetical protein Dsin_013369 [Dipteronia sinensis]
MDGLVGTLRWRSRGLEIEMIYDGKGKTWDGKGERVKRLEMRPNRRCMIKRDLLWKWWENHRRTVSLILGAYGRIVSRPWLDGSESSVPQSRLVWVSYWGIPLSCWTQEFFNNLGWLIGELVLIDKETLLKNSLHKGRMMVLVPQSTDCSCKIKVSGEYMSFVVKVEEERNLVDVQWLEGFLALRKTQNHGSKTFMAGKEVFQIREPTMVGEVSTLRLAQHDMSKGTQVGSSQIKRSGTKVRKVLIKQRKKDDGNMVFVVKGVFEKGKQKRARKQPKKPMTFYV